MRIQIIPIIKYFLAYALMQYFLAYALMSLHVVQKIELPFAIFTLKTLFS
jgi:hypothetical protein